VILVCEEGLGSSSKSNVLSLWRHRFSPTEDMKPEKCILGAILCYFIVNCA
jgi:hypothetical protein